MNLKGYRVTPIYIPNMHNIRDVVEHKLPCMQNSYFANDGMSLGHDWATILLFPYVKPPLLGHDWATMGHKSVDKPSGTLPISF